MNTTQGQGLGTAAHARLGEVIRRRRESAGMTRVQLAQRVGISESTLQRIERGNPNHKPDARALADLSRVLEVTADDVLDLLAGEPGLAAETVARLDMDAGRAAIRAAAAGSGKAHVASAARADLVAINDEGVAITVEIKSASNTDDAVRQVAEALAAHGFTPSRPIV